MSSALARKWFQKIDNSISAVLISRDGLRLRCQVPVINGVPHKIQRALPPKRRPFTQYSDLPPGVPILDYREYQYQGETKDGSYVYEEI